MPTIKRKWDLLSKDRRTVLIKQTFENLEIDLDLLLNK